MWAEDIITTLLLSDKATVCCIEKISNGMIFWTDGTKEKVKTSNEVENYGKIYSLKQEK